MTNSTKSQHPLNGAFERVRRAGEHLVELKNGIEVWRAAQAKTAAINPDPEHPDKLIAGIIAVVPIPLRAGILVGEICYNLRAALDYLVFELAYLDSGIRQDGTQFPIEGKEKDFRYRQKGGWLKGINDAHVAAIELLQPYNGCAWTKTLQAIRNPDNHRTLSAFMGDMGLDIAIAGTDPPDAEFNSKPGIISRTMHPHTRLEVNVKLHLTTVIKLTDGTPVMEALEVVKLKVAETLDAFKPEFK
jgi:hypothetical protein